MSTYYLRVEDKAGLRKILIDMSYLSNHKVIRLPKYYYEAGLYLPFIDKKENTLQRYELSKDKIFKEDNHFFYFRFPFKHEQVVEAAV